MPEVTCPTGYRALWSFDLGRNMCTNDAGEMIEPLTTPPPGQVVEQPWGLMPGTPWQEQAGVSGEASAEEAYWEKLFASLVPPDRIEIVQKGGYDYEYAYDAEGNLLSIERVGVHREKGREPWEEEQALWERGYLEEQFTWEQEEARRQARTQQQQFLQGVETERQQYLKGLAAQPVSWLEYAAASGQPAAVQPWMLPLMPQEYSQLQAGAQIPGFTATSMAGMPELSRPSRQYQARMGPTAMQQYQGYRQARTGARPEETEWRLWSKAPPSGEFAPIRYRK